MDKQHPECIYYSSTFVRLIQRECLSKFFIRNKYDKNTYEVNLNTFLIISIIEMEANGLIEKLTDLGIDTQYFHQAILNFR